jgi:hypothetical protein
MSTNNPNRNRNHSADRNRMPQKNSGDQHIFPEDEFAQNPYRSHRISREDMHRFSATPVSDQDNLESS